MTDFYYKDNRYIIKDFEKKKPFSSFLPGIAGLDGIPLWAFYVNRGQGIASFGHKDKNGAILEFFPANAAYQYIDKIGFRSFVKENNKVYEMFKVGVVNVERRMEISESEFSIIEVNSELMIEYKVTYYILPSESFGGLVRMVEVKDLSESTRELEIADGLAQLFPSGIDYGGYKAVSNLLRSWMEVTNLENDFAFYKLRSTTNDSAEVSTLNIGNYLITVRDGRLVKPICDSNLIFGNDTSLSLAINFIDKSVDEISREEQVNYNKVPCGFSLIKWNTRDKLVFNTVIGHTENDEIIKSKIESLVSYNYFYNKQVSSKKIIDDLVDEVTTNTNITLFDKYLKQNYLDNLLRGGYPLILADKVYHVYSRKHGDLERDYNFFVSAPEYFSQGNGNFRDVLQNRRNDVLIEPKVDDFNIYFFGNLIQADGFNPLEISGTKLSLKEDCSVQSLLKELNLRSDLLEVALKEKYTPGEVIKILIDDCKLSYDESIDKLDIIAINSEQEIVAEFGEGYWQDHFTYLIDLIDSYLSIYPDKLDELLFERSDYKYYSAKAHVLPRCDKYVINKQGEVRQYNSILHDHEKINKLGLAQGSNWHKDNDGNIIKTNLFSKLFTLVVNKYLSLDPEGIGIAYEANKPGWNDAMNGLPGLFGSGVGEVIELSRLLKFLCKVANQNNEKELLLLDVFVELINQVIIDKDFFDYNSWDYRSTLLEEYRRLIRFEANSSKLVKVKDIQEILEMMTNKVEKGIKLALEIGEGIYPTYLYYSAKKYEVIKVDGVSKTTNELVNVKIQEFERHMIPHFLEAPARSLKLDNDLVNHKELYNRVKNSDLYDDVLKFYKTSIDLSNLSLEIGRIVAFSKGWFERESNFLHMTYKYIYSLLYAGLYDEFYKEIKTNLVCFMEPEIYGRSIFENSSFIVSSNNPDKRLWGQGMVARLSGSTAEVLSIWHLMFFGKNIFKYENGELSFSLSPKLHSSFFTKDGIVSSFLFKNIEVVYNNPKMLNTYDKGVFIEKMEFIGENYKFLVNGNNANSNIALQIREGYISRINLFINN